MPSLGQGCNNSCGLLGLRAKTHGTAAATCRRNQNRGRDYRGDAARHLQCVFEHAFPLNLDVYTSPLNLQPSLLLFACRLTAGGQMRAGVLTTVRVLPSVQTDCPSDV